MAKRPLGLGKSHEKKHKKKKTSSKTPETQLEPKPKQEAQVTENPVGEEDNEQSATPEAAAGGELMIKMSFSGLNELAQLWLSYAKKKISKESFDNESNNNQLILNGIIHECDRLLRKSHNLKEQKATKKQENPDDEEEEVKLDGQFYSIYGLALAELAYFQTLEDEEEQENQEEKEFDEAEEAAKNKAKAEQVAAFFSEAHERISVGLEKFPNDELVLKLAESQVLANQIPLQWISTMSVNSTKKQFPDILSKVDQVFANLDAASELLDKSKDNDSFNSFYDFQQFSLLDTLDDLLDMIENFGINDDLNEIDSDNEEELEAASVQLSKKHPLSAIREKIDVYADKLIASYDAFLQHLVQVSKQHYKIDLEGNLHENKSHTLVNFYLKVNEKLGQLYLKKADEAGKEYTDIVYGDDDDESGDEKEDDSADNDEDEKQKLAKPLQKIAIDNYKKAIKHLKVCEDEEDPATWVNIAEVEISLGNIYELNSEKQESLYKKAEKKLRKANRATGGKYEHILRNLVDN